VDIGNEFAADKRMADRKRDYIVTVRKAQSYGV